MTASGRNDGVLFRKMQLLDGRGADAWLESRAAAGIAPHADENATPNK